MILCGFMNVFPITSTNANASVKEDYYQIYLADYLSENSAKELNMPYRKHVEDRISNPTYNAFI